MLLAGCSGGEAPTGAPASQSPSATQVEAAPAEPEPTPTEISLEDAGAQYLALVEPFNVAAAAWEEPYRANDWPAVRTAAAGLAETGRAFADGLVASEWPSSAQPTVDALVGELAGEVPVYLSIAASTTDQELIDLTYTFPERQSNAQKLRILLGLPDVSVS